MQQNILQETKRFNLLCHVTKKEALPLDDNLFIYLFTYGLFNDISG
jgi:hypothetical protein